MPSLPPALRGPIFMVVATGSYVINDTFMKLATDGLPPYEVLFLRGVAAFLWGAPLLAIMGQARNVRLMADRRVLVRSCLELFAVLCYVVALANMPIADAIALGQVTPLLMLVGAALFFGERIGGRRAGLIALGFLGAIMVAQPTMAGISVFALLALGNAVFSAGRDLWGRSIDASVPGLIVAMSAVVVVIIGAGGAHLSSETWVMPGTRHLLLLAASGFFLVFGHFFIFTAYRSAATSTVAPFYYSFTVWAVISGLVVFGELPNLLAGAGILLVAGSGLAIVISDRRRQRLVATA
ncbi:DMT family transporter [Aquibium carbonis]|uniref:DMT family transporter n=1 Tax=Aquibium carbonis TaxID=2495581 RepID=A0A3S0G3D1_9HYPH|nr:DMT family transporter [Aquibium carbonis]RST82807.1 DMT family transporter [Aquibium carbonis]